VICRKANKDKRLTDIMRIKKHRASAASRDKRKATNLSLSCFSFIPFYLFLFFFLHAKIFK